MKPPPVLVFLLPRQEGTPSPIRRKVKVHDTKNGSRGECPFGGHRLVTMKRMESTYSNPKIKKQGATSGTDGEEPKDITSN